MMLFDKKAVCPLPPTFQPLAPFDLVTEAVVGSGNLRDERMAGLAKRKTLSERLKS
jgi:hypothetical protein